VNTDINGCNGIKERYWNLILAFPMLEIINIASSADVEELARLN